VATQNRPVDRGRNAIAARPTGSSIITDFRPTDPIVPPRVDSAHTSAQAAARNLVDREAQAMQRRRSHTAALNFSQAIIAREAPAPIRPAKSRLRSFSRRAVASVRTRVRLPRRSATRPRWQRSWRWPLEVTLAMRIFWQARQVTGRGAVADRGYGLNTDGSQASG